jgi:predicted transcriptional regulator
MSSGGWSDKEEQMKKTILTFFFIFLWCVLPAWAVELKVGDKAPDFSLKDLQGKVYTLDSDELKGRVVSIFYIDPDKKGLNNHVEYALLKEKGLDRNKTYKDLSIVNMKSTRMPNFIIKSVIKDKKEKTRAIILIDYDYSIVTLWGMKKQASSVVVLDKERICRYVYSGKLPPEEVTKLINVIKEYQVK